jgi:hypothetical protein
VIAAQLGAQGPFSRPGQQQADALHLCAPRCPAQAQPAPAAAVRGRTSRRRRTWPSPPGSGRAAWSC